MIACPRPACRATFEATGQLAAHLQADHGLTAAAAMNEAWRASAKPGRPAPQPTPEVSPLTAYAAQAAEEPPMPTGVYERKTDPTKPCGYCKRPKDDHRPKCPYGPDGKGRGKSRRRSPATPPATRSSKPRTAAVPRDVAGNGTKALAQELLTQLEGIRSKLDSKITAVRELVEIL